MLKSVQDRDKAQAPCKELRKKAGVSTIETRHKKLMLDCFKTAIVTNTLYLKSTINSRKFKLTLKNIIKFVLTKKTLINYLATMFIKEMILYLYPVGAVGGLIVLSAQVLNIPLSQTWLSCVR